VALACSLVAALFAGSALAANTGPAADIGAEVWLGLFSSVIFALLAGYSRGLERRMDRMDTGLSARIKMLEHEDRQKSAAIALMRETVLREHPSRAETAEHRAHVEAELHHIRERLDYLARPHHRSSDR
jgi:hypothetical protein